MTRIFGYNRAVARTNSHFGGVEEGTEFAISDLRFFIENRHHSSLFFLLVVLCVGKKKHFFAGAKETSRTFSTALTQL